MTRPFGGTQASHLLLGNWGPGWLSGSQPEVRVVFACCWGGGRGPVMGVWLRSHPAGGGGGPALPVTGLGRSAGGDRGGRGRHEQDRAGCGILEKSAGHWQEAGGRGLKVKVTGPCRPCPLKLPDPIHSTPRGQPATWKLCPWALPSLSSRLRCQPSGASEVPLALQDTCHPPLQQRHWG